MKFERTESIKQKHKYRQRYAAQRSQQQSRRCLARRAIVIRIMVDFE